MENKKDLDYSKENAILVINNGEQMHRPSSQNNNYQITLNNVLYEPTSLKELNEQSINKKICLLDELKINSEKIIRPDYILLKSETQALITKTPKINVENLSTEQLIQILKNEKENESIFINMSELEDKYLSNNSFEEDTGLIETDDMKFMDKIYTDVIERHPFNVVEGKSRKLPCCSNTGWFCGCGKCRRSKLDSLGIGMIVYFKFLKALLCGLFTICILNIFLINAYYSNNKSKNAQNYMDVFFKSTIGNIGSTLYNCIKIPISALTNHNYLIELQCGKMTLSDSIIFGVPDNQEDDKQNKENCFNYLPFNDNIKVSSMCDMSSIIHERMSLCAEGSSSCSIFIDMTLLECHYQPQFEYLYLSYSCYNNEVSLGYKDKTVKRSDFSFIVVFIDISSMIILIMTFLVIEKCKEINNQKFMEESTFIRDFTLHLKDIHIKKTDIQQEYNDLIEHFNNIAKVEDPSLSIFQFEDICIRKQSCFGDYIHHVQENLDPKKYFVYDITYPILTLGKLDSIKKFHKLQKRLNEELEKEAAKNNKLSKDSKTQKLNNEIVYESLEVRKQSKDEIKIREKMEKIKESVNTIDDVKEITELYITFRNYRITKFFEELYKKSKCERCHTFFCCKGDTIKHLYYKGKWLNLTFTKDEPTNIKWENLTFNQSKRCCRSCISFCFGIILMLVTLCLILFCKYYQAELTKDYNTFIDCDKVSNWKFSELVAKEYSNTTLTTKEKVLTYCYCNQFSNFKNLVSGFLKDIVIENGTKPCIEFSDSFLQFTLINIGLILVIPIINAIVAELLKCLTKFQRNKTLSEDMSASMWKIFLIQFINTGLLLIFVNMKIDSVHKKIPSFPFFAGNFDDMDPEWYKNVGVVIILSMLVNIIMPHFPSLINLIFNYILRCYDSGCLCGKITHKKRKKDYFSLYTGPVFDMESRYATILSTLYVVLFFSPGMPILYICFFFFLLFTYFIDKYLITQFYRMPPKYDLNITDQFSQFKTYGIILHFCFSIWIYGNPFLLIDVSFSNPTLHQGNFIETLLIKNKNFGNALGKRIVLNHNIPLLIILILLILVRIIVIFLIVPLKALFCQEKNLSLNKTSNIEIGLAVPLKQLYKNYQIKKIEYFQNLKHHNNNEALLNDLRYGINYAKNFMVFKISKVYEGEVNELKRNFEKIIEESPELIEVERKSVIKGDPSYNIAFIPEFESFAYYEYLKNM